MTFKKCSPSNDDFDDISDNYDITMFPKNVSDAEKSGITIKGNNEEYINAHKSIKDIFRKKGERFFINNNEVCVTDVPTNKPICVEVKTKNSLSGKANLKIYDKNAKGVGTIMITKPSGSELIHAKNLAFKVIKFLLDGLISNDISQEYIDQMKRKPLKDKHRIKCDCCGDLFENRNLLDDHMNKTHNLESDVVCDICDTKFKSNTDMIKHKEEDHMDTGSPLLKKIKLNGAEDSNVDEDIIMTEVKDKKEVGVDVVEPGYIGSRMLDVTQESEDDNLFSKKILEVREEFEALKQEFQLMKIELERQNKKQIETLKTQIKGLKEDFKQCMEDLKAETYARLKAESMAKVLKDTLEAKAKVDAQIVDMEVDKVNNDEVSKEDDIQVNVMMSKNAEVPSQNENRCNVCDSNFDTKEGLENHMKTNHICGHCAESFETQRTLIEHVGFHHDNAQGFSY